MPVVGLTGGPGTGKTAVLRERFARLIEGGADPERVALVVRSRWARSEARAALLDRLRTSLPALKVLTVQALALHVVSRRFDVLGYSEPPRVLSAADQFSRVRDLLAGEDPRRWPAYGAMLHLRGFADQVRQFLLRAQEALLEPEEILEKADAAGLSGWRELAEFYRRYLEGLDDDAAVDFAGLVEQAAVAAGKGKPLFDHLLVDDYQDTTLGTEALIAALNAEDLVVAGDLGGHVFSFQGTTDLPLRRFAERFPTAGHVELRTGHRATGVVRQAWFAAHTSEEHAAVARELRRIHVEEGTPWGDLAVVVRRQGSHLGGLLRALDDAGVPRTVPQSGLSLPAEPATFPFVLALQWLARPEERDGLIEALLTSELVGLSPAAALGAIRAARASGGSPADALRHTEVLFPEEAGAVERLRDVLEEAGAVAGRSVLDAFSILWRRLPYSTRLVEAANEPGAPQRDLDAVLALADAVTRAGQSADPSFVDSLEPAGDGPGPGIDEGLRPDAVAVLTAHGAAGQGFDTVIVVGAVEGNFPSLARPEPMFDLAMLDRRISRSERNRLRLEDERRLFRLLTGRARRRIVFTASDAHGEETRITTRSRFVDELGLEWTPAPVGPFDEPISANEAAAGWRRTLADRAAPPPERLAAIGGLLALGSDPSRWWFQRDWTGTDRPLHEKIRVSYSRLETLENCELQYVLREELGLGRPAGYQAWTGKLVHRIIEDCENGLIERTPDALAAAAEERWRPQEFPSLAVSEAFRKLVTERMLPNWLARYGEKPAVAKEIGFTFEFEGATVSGYIDRIGEILSGGNRITDYKTGKADNAGKAEDNLQLGIYFLAVNEAEELAPYRPVRGVELAFLRGHWRTGDIELRGWQVNSASDEEYQAGMRERLSELIGRIRELTASERYRPNPAADCYFCEFKTLCPMFPEGQPLFPLPEEVQA